MLFSMKHRSYQQRYFVTRKHKDVVKVHRVRTTSTVARPVGGGAAVAYLQAATPVDDTSLSMPAQRIAQKTANTSFKAEMQEAKQAAANRRIQT
jgi:hypothetical protein